MLLLERPRVIGRQAPRPSYSRVALPATGVVLPEADVVAALPAAAASASSSASAGGEEAGEGGGGRVVAGALARAILADEQQEWSGGGTPGIRMGKLRRAGSEPAAGGAPEAMPVAALREAVERLCAAAEPVQRSGDNAAGDVEAMRDELARWVAEGARARAALAVEQATTREAAAPLLREASSARQRADAARAAIARAQARLAAGDARIRQLVDGAVFSR